ncbi:cobalamin biosynthesis protein CobD [Sphaerisporangium melleum]|uniref:Cobalamin biosynthesis protein CobD n=1 Tax=Sphaerisporangium melleum TaxID=321316 RepID=A0A917RI28_9ACTN|nr:cobalamin biosynthesis protein [Sphaerisporangium melleum]GGL06929.1 cobalamin biosynthesis protein CobD [Sphaerisporangium melleum]GII74257.1 cobalamin biosynthesis protein CobD [Sphaerisporangium melleum]
MPGLVPALGTSPVLRERSARRHAATAGRSGWKARAAGLAAGVVLDAVFADPRSGAHPVAVFGRAAAAVERRLYGRSRGRGVAHVAVCVGTVTVLGAAAERLTRRAPAARATLTAVATWAVLGGTTLGREGTAMSRALESGDLAAARARLPHLCGRDPSGLSAGELARATVESVAENTSDAVVAPLVWGAVAGVPGLLAYRAVNTLDAMVGHRSDRYERFGWAAARLDDGANYLPARLTGALACALAPLVGGTPGEAAAVLRRDGGRHPSPNSGRCEAAFAGALGVRLGGRNVYGERVEHRPVMGDGPEPEVADIPRSVRLAHAINLTAAALAVGVAWTLGRRRRALAR